MIQSVVEYSGLDVSFFISEFPNPLGQTNSPTPITELLSLDSEAPLSSSDVVRLEVRNLLRQKGFKPTGRSKPASEYLLKAASSDQLGSINLAVDCCNAVSLHSGLPISVVDIDRLSGVCRIDVPEPGASYVFNRSGQEIDIGRLLCLFDEEGPCANAVKDSQRTKTDENSVKTLSILWGTDKLSDRTARATDWYRQLLEDCGVKTSRENS